MKTMDCRTFHKNLEDYLQDGLDYSGRFGMERHARQCIRCGKDMTEAQELRRMVSDLKRVKAPADFESSLLDKIRMSRSRDHFSALRRFWIYSLDWPSWRRPVLAASGLAALVLGFVFSFQWTAPKQTPPAPLIAVKPAKVDDGIKPLPVVKSTQASPVPALAVPNPPVLRSRHTPAALSPSEVQEVAAEVPSPGTARRELFEDAEAKDMEYVEFVLSGHGNRPVPVRLLPRKIRIQYRPASEEYFIQNVSH